MRVVECGAAGDCLFLVFAFFMDFEIPAPLDDRRVLANSMRSLLYTFASTSSFRLEVTSDDALSDELLDNALQNLKEPGSPDVDGV